MNPSPRTRRQFFSSDPLRQLRHPEAPPQAAGGGDPRRGQPGGYLLEISRAAMACQFIVHLPAHPNASAPERAVEALELLEPLEQQMSVFRPDSDISRINRSAAETWVPAEPRLVGLLRRASDLSQATDGAFDITAGPLVKLWGFFHRQGKVPAAAQIAEVLQHVGHHLVLIDPHHQTVHFQRPGVEINLGAIGKGYALDRCADWLLEHGVEDFLVHGGFSSVVSRGDRHPSGSPQAGWLVAIRHPLRPRQSVAEIWLRHQALGTSGSGTQYFYHRGRRYGHVLDPRSGQPAEGIYSATAVAPQAAEADALSTAFSVMGAEATEDYCRRHAGVGALLVVPGEKAGEVDLLAFGMEGVCWRACQV